ncbi:metallophosphoesterase [Herbaspirillum sp. GCM10030257]|uniref:metallophosphoesterase family protein n=1 Tax=Herbaspirillum sp. GCM10030257 TaxID=3273393 RepID=UPI00360D4A72
MTMMLICGDPHRAFSHIVDSTLKNRPDAVILLGDMECLRPLHEELETILDRTEIWWIPGNHDTDKEYFYDNLFGSSLANRNLHGRVADVAGLRVAGLGGVFRRSIWMPTDPEGARYDSLEDYRAHCGKGNLWRGGAPLKQRSSIFPDQYKRLMTQRADILVTHEAPSYHEFGYAAITSLAENMGVRAAFHGHQHIDIQYPRTVWHGVGERGLFLFESVKSCANSHPK